MADLAPFQEARRRGYRVTVLFCNGSARLYVVPEVYSSVLDLDVKVAVPLQALLKTGAISRSSVYRKNICLLKNPRNSQTYISLVDAMYLLRLPGEVILQMCSQYLAHRSTELRIRNELEDLIFHVSFDALKSLLYEYNLDTLHIKAALHPSIIPWHRNGEDVFLIHNVISIEPFRISFSEEEKYALYENSYIRKSVVSKLTGYDDINYLARKNDWPLKVTLPGRHFNCQGTYYMSLFVISYDKFTSIFTHQYMPEYIPANSVQHRIDYIIRHLGLSYGEEINKKQEVSYDNSNNGSS